MNSDQIISQTKADISVIKAKAFLLSLLLIVLEIIVMYAVGLSISSITVAIIVYGVYLLIAKSIVSAKVNSVVTKAIDACNKLDAQGAVAILKKDLM